MKKLVFALVVLMISSGVLADISISEPSPVYNLGDRLYVDLGGLRGAYSGNLDINLLCGNESVNLVRIPARAFSLDEDQSYSIPYKVLDWEDLGISNLASIVGTCQVVASLAETSVSSKSFEISSNIVVSVSLDGSSYNPGEDVSVTIEAVKENGASVNGFVEGSNASSFSKAIKDGVAEEVFSIPDSAEAGIYNLRIRAYDVGSGGVLNEGLGFVSYEVNQVATSLVLSLSGNSVVPGENFSIGAEVFDQSGVAMNGNVFINLVSPEGEKTESVVQTGGFVSTNFESNSSVGTWKIISQFDDLVQKREFEVLPLQKVEFDFEDSVLVIKNVGNVLYNKSINVNIANDSKVLDLNIGVGDVRKFSLEAPMGEYDIVVGDGDYEVNRHLLLTGNAISVDDLKSVGFLNNYSIVWVFLIIVFGGIGGVLIMRYRKTRTLGEKSGFIGKLSDKMHLGGRKLKAGDHAIRRIGEKVTKKLPSEIKSQMDDSLTFTRKSPAVQGLDSKNYSHKDKSMVDFTGKGSVSAESVLVLKGEKHPSSVVALEIKNFSTLNDVARGGLRDIIENAKGKGVVDYRSDYIFVIFNPLITRTYSNESLAVRCAVDISEKLIVYNKKFKDRVEFGIGVHSGDLVASKKGSKLKYTGIGNSISFAKRMSGISSANVVISEVVHKKLLRDLRVLKGKDIGEKKTYVVEEMRDKSGDRARLKQLMSRSENSF